MILHGNQRAGAAGLATHLMNDRDNDHVEVHEIRGAVATTLPGALDEMDAVRRGTRCKQFLFSVSFNPPPDAQVSVDTFIDAIDRVEREVGLQGQPRVIVFHEKNSRRHAHCVWSRVKADEMKAINLPFYKTRLAGVAKELYLDHGWDLPAGLIDRHHSNPLNYTLAQWQQAQRRGDDPRRIKTALRECWSITKDKRAFDAALQQHGYFLARGDRRGFVAVDWRGEVYSLSRWLDVKNKELQSRLGKPNALPCVAETTARIDKDLIQRFEQHQRAVKQKQQAERMVLSQLKATLVAKQRAERETLRQQQEARWTAEARQRAARLRSGWRGVWDQMTGARQRTKTSNEREAYDAMLRDRRQRDQLIWSHIKERGVLSQQRREQPAKHGIQLDDLAAVLPERIRPRIAPDAQGPSLGH